MSLSHQSATSVESPWTAEEKRETFRCPTCGAEAFRWVTEDCKLLDGTVVPDLEHLKCFECGERCFDIAAMRRIREVRESLVAKKKDRRAPARRTLETNDA